MTKEEIKKDLRSLRGLLDNWNKDSFKKVRHENLLNNLRPTVDRNGRIHFEMLESQFLIFQNIDIENHAIPKGIEKMTKEDRDAEIKLIVKITENNTTLPNTNRVYHLAVNMIFESYYKDEIFTSSIHIDKPISHDPTVNVIHPLFHLNFGGGKMTKEEETDFRNMFLMASPRLVHYPMDIVLAIDFVVKNFYFETNHKSLTDNPTYKEIVKRAGNRILKPYFQSIASYWELAEPIDNLNPKELHPSLV